jgi:hypothetical protein
MRKLLLSAALLAVSGAAAPVAAQNYAGDFRGGAQIERRLQRIDLRIERAVERNRISQREAQRLGRELDTVDRLYDRYRVNGLTQWENRDLQNRVNILQQRVAYVIRDDNWRGSPDFNDRNYVERDRDIVGRDRRYGDDDGYYGDDD